MTFEEANKLAKKYLSVTRISDIYKFNECFEAFSALERPADICETCLHKHECSIPEYTDQGIFKCNFYEEK